jgi:hypothetical protein
MRLHGAFLVATVDFNEKRATLAWGEIQDVGGLIGRKLRRRRIEPERCRPASLVEPGIA